MLTRLGSGRRWAEAGEPGAAPRRPDLARGVRGDRRSCRPGRNVAGVQGDSLVVARLRRRRGIRQGRAAAGRAICAGVPKQVRPRRLASAAPRCLVEGLVVPRASDGTNARLMLVRRTGPGAALQVRWAARRGAARRQNARSAIPACRERRRRRRGAGPRPGSRVPGRYRPVLAVLQSAVSRRRAHRDLIQPVGEQHRYANSQRRVLRVKDSEQLAGDTFA